MTQAIAGFSGKVFVSTNGGSSYSAVGEMHDATLSISNNEIDVTSFDSSGWSEFIPGLKEWEADTEGLYIYADAGQSALYTALTGNTIVKLRLIPKNTTGQTGYQGDAFITSFEVNNTTDDAVSLKVSFRGTGALTTYTAP